MGAFNALGTIAFAFGGHNVVLEIQVLWPLTVHVTGQLLRLVMSPFLLFHSSTVCWRQIEHVCCIHPIQSN